MSRRVLIVESIDLRRLDATMPDGWCSCCRRELTEEENRLVIDVCDDGTTSKRLTLCRPYISEHAPHILAQLEAEA